MGKNLTLHGALERCLNVVSRSKCAVDAVLEELTCFLYIWMIADDRRSRGSEKRNHSRTVESSGVRPDGSLLSAHRILFHFSRRLFKVANGSCT